MASLRLLLLLFSSISIVLAGDGCSLWPKPRNATLGTTTLLVDKGTFRLAVSGQSSQMLDRAVARYHDIIFFNGYERGNGASGLSSVAITVDDPSADLQLFVDESYLLSISSESGTGEISAKTQFGAMRGLETLSQLIESVDAGKYQLPCADVAISDRPEYPHRGLLIDTARHYLPLDVIKGAIDGLAFVKMNTLHWHIVDDQSFPLVPRSYPGLADGAYWPGHTVYSMDDVAAVVAHGLDRGVRVILELDVPGHTRSWGVGLPNITLHCPDARMINPVGTVTFDVLRAVLGDVAGVTIDDVVHLGGDEVSYDCWKASPEVTQWMKAHQTTDPTDVYRYFEASLHNMTGKTVTHWQEVFNLGIDVPRDTTIMHVWKDAATLKAVVQAGYRGVMSFGWYIPTIPHIPPISRYLDHLADTWEAMYNNPMYHALGFSDAEDAAVIGGEACMWGEKVDESNFAERVWPRTAAVSERLWMVGPGEVTEAEPRLSAHRCRLVRRGVGASPIAPGFCQWAV